MPDPGGPDPVGDAIAANDLDALVRLVDDCCGERDWEMLEGLRARARAAFGTGRQLWPAADYAEYRLALDAPAPHAAGVLTDDAGRFAPGPLSEVAASTHTWAELAPHVAPGPVAALAAHERVVRGEVVDAAGVADAAVLGVPLALAPWEPRYFVATYRPGRVDAPGPDPVRGRPIVLPSAYDRVDDPETSAAFGELVRPWTVHDAGSARVAAVEGDAAAAIAALGVREARGARVAGAEAVAMLAWAGASGGPHGRRRGAATGRELAWAVLAELVGAGSGEPFDPGALGAGLDGLRWAVWAAPDRSTGWVLRLAAESPREGVAWACDLAAD